MSIDPCDCVQATNLTLDERGGMKWRNGCFNVAALPGTSGKTPYIFWSSALQVFLCARESAGTFKLFTSPTGAVWTDRGTINSAVASEAAFVDFPRAGAGAAGPVVVIACTGRGATQGVVFIDSTFALTFPATGANIAGNSIVLWQDRAIIAGYPTTDANGTPAHYFACAPKDPATWSTAGGGWNNQLRELNGDVITGLGVLSGAMIAFKRTSTYRINDSSTGAYITIDASAGCVNPRAVAGVYGRLYAWGADGMYECDGIGPMKNVGEKILPVYSDANTVTATVVAGVHKGRVFFSGQLPSSYLMYEFDPRHGWIMRHVMGSAAQDKITSFTVKDGVLYAGIADGDDFFRMFTESPGADDGTQILGTWTSPWFLPNSGMLARLQQVLFQGLTGQGTTTAVLVSIFRNWDYSAGFEQYDIGTALRAQDAGDVQLTAPLKALGHGASFGFQIDLATAPGSVSLRSMQLIDASLEWPSPGYPRGSGALAGRGSGPPPPPNR